MLPPEFNLCSRAHWAPEDLYWKLGLATTDVTPHFTVLEGGETVKVLARFGGNDVRIIDAPYNPDITQPDDAIVKSLGPPSAVGQIHARSSPHHSHLGSDIHLFYGEVLALQKYDILSHEFTGIIDRGGPSVESSHTGPRRVIVSFEIACGKYSYYVHAKVWLNGPPN